MLHQGLAKHTPLTFGAANIVVGIAVLLLAWALGGPPGWGTVANAVLIGSFIQLLTSIDAVGQLAHEGVEARVGLLAGGIAIFGVGTAFYIGASLGAGPRDTLMLVGAHRTGRRIGLVRGVLELAVLAIGFALGGTVGVGTLAFALGIGPSVEAAFWLLARSPLAEQGPPRGTEPPFRHGSEPGRAGL